MTDLTSAGALDDESKTFGTVGGDMSEPGSPAASKGRKLGAKVGEQAGAALDQATAAVQARKADAESLLAQSLEVAQAKADQAKEWASQTYDQSVEWTGVKSEAARKTIREKPLTAAATVFGAGVLLGMLLNRR